MYKAGRLKTPRDTEFGQDGLQAGRAVQGSGRPRAAGKLSTLNSDPNGNPK